MKVLIAVTVCVVVHDDGDPRKVAAACGNPLEDLIARMRREMQHGRDSVQWGESDGTKVS